MDLLRGIALRMRALLRRDSVEREMDDEMRFHLQMAVEENVRRGMSEEEAERAARYAFGGVDRHQEAMRDGRGWRWLEDLLRDLRYGSRTLLRNPGFSAAAVLTLALAIGTNSAVFSLVNGFVLRPFPVPQPNGLTSLWNVDQRDGGANEM